MRRAAALLLLCLALLSCSNDQPIRIGFSGQLTGTKSDLGVQGRNGAMLAVEEINAAGGIHGRTLELLAEDDMDTPEGAVWADNLLLDKGVVAIIGHMTTSQSLAACPVVEKRGGVLISPTTAAPSLENRLDGFFRVIPSNTKWAETMVTYALSKGFQTAYFVGDADNAGYTDTLLATLDREYAKQGGRFVGSRLYSSRAGVDWQSLAQTIRKAKPTVLFVCTAARDLAALAQALRPTDAGIAVLAPPWPASRELVLAGGQAVEGFCFVTNFADDNAYPAFVAFKSRFLRRFGWKPSFAAAFAYESVSLLAEALKRTDGHSAGLKAALVNGPEQQGIIGPFAMTAQGDVKRQTFITMIRQGHLVLVDTAGGPR